MLREGDTITAARCLKCGGGVTYDGIDMPRVTSDAPRQVMARCQSCSFSGAYDLDAGLWWNGRSLVGFQQPRYFTA